MKRPAIITAGIVVLLLVLGIWVYLLLNGAPQSPREVFSDLGLISEAPQTIETDFQSELNTGEEDVLVSISGAALQQLTTEPVAGFTFVIKDEREVMRYVERGTGHIFDIDITSGNKQQISQTTISNTIDAVFSPKGSVVVLIAEEGNRDVIVGELPGNGNTNLQQTRLPSDAQNIHVVDERTVLYTRTDTEQTVGFSHDIPTQTATQLFAVAIPDAIMFLTSTSTSDLYVHTKPTEHLEGFLYHVVGGKLAPVGTSGYGLTSFGNGPYVAVSAITIEEKNYTSVVHDITIDGELRQPVLMIPEKCAFEFHKENVWCASEFEAQNSISYIEDWYKGVIIPQDMLWNIHFSEETATLVANLSELSGRTIDVTDIVIDTANKHLLFKNKIDRTLWMYSIYNTN